MGANNFAERWLDFLSKKRENPEKAVIKSFAANL